MTLDQILKRTLGEESFDAIIHLAAVEVITLLELLT